MADGFLGRWSRRKAGKEDDAPLKDVDLPNELAQTPVIESAPELAAPPTDPFSVTVLPAQTCRVVPEFAVALGFTVTITLKVLPVQLPETGVTV